MSLSQPDNQLFLGRGGSGKTWLALRRAADFPRVLYVRPEDRESPPFPELPRGDRVALCNALKLREFKWTFTTDGDAALWETANEAAYRRGDVLVIWEEAGTLMDRKPLPTWAHKLWMVGRHVHCRIFACSQRPARVSADCRANLSRAAIFATTEPGDLQFYRDMIGDKAALDRIRSLARFEAVDFDPLQGWTVKKSPF